MLDFRKARFALGMLAILAFGACASSPNVWERHDLGAKRRVVEAMPNLVTCPVVVSNRTGEMLDAGYSVGGVSSVLGLIPAGRSLTFGVSCEGGTIQAFAATTASPASGEQMYRTVADVARAGATRIDFSLANRIH